MTGLLLAVALGQLDGGHVLTVDAARLHLGDAGVPQTSVDALGWPITADRAVLALAGQAGASDADAGTPWNDTEWLGVGAGCYLPAGKCLSAGQRTAQLEAENLELRAAPRGLLWVWVTLAVGLVVGAAAAITIDFGLRGLLH